MRLDDTSAAPPQASAVNPQDEATITLALGKAAVNRGDYETAIKEFQRLADDPHRAEAWHGRGATHFNRGEYGLAESDFRRAVQLEPTETEYRTHHAYSLVKLDQCDEAVKEILDGLARAKPEAKAALQGEVARIYDARAVRHQSLGQHDAALADLLEAVRWDSTNADTIHDLGCAYFNVGSFQKAVEELTRAIVLDSTKLDYFAHRGHALRALGKEEEGLADYESARRLGKKSPDKSGR